MKNFDPLELRELIKKANNNDVESQYQLGVLYMEGAEGFPADESKGVMWLSRAVDLGYAEAQIYLYRNVDGYNELNEIEPEPERSILDEFNSPDEELHDVLRDVYGSLGIDKTEPTPPPPPTPAPIPYSYPAAEPLPAAPPPVASVPAAPPPAVKPPAATAKGLIIRTLFATFGLLLQTALAALFFVLLWMSDALDSLIISVRDNENIAGQEFLGFLRLSGNEYVFLAQTAIPLGVLSIAVGMLSLVFIRGCRSGLGILIIGLMIAAQAFSYTLWHMGTRRIPHAEDFVLLVMLVLIYVLAALPGILIEKAGSTWGIRRANRADIPAIFFGVLTLAAFILGMYSVWGPVGGL